MNAFIRSATTLSFLVATNISAQPTTVIVFRVADRIVVAADSLMRSGASAGWKFSKTCKIQEAAGMYVAFAGFASETGTDFDTYALALRAIRTTKGGLIPAAGGWPIQSRSVRLSGVSMPLGLPHLCSILQRR